VEAISVKLLSEDGKSLNYAAANFYALVLFSVCFVILLTVYLINRKLLMKIG